MKRYQIIKHESLRKLADHVSALVDEGWQPLGGVAIGQEGVEPGQDSHFYAQAVHPPVSQKPLALLRPLNGAPMNLQLVD